jgi:hypothetical protein
MGAGVVGLCIAIFGMVMIRRVVESGLLNVIPILMVVLFESPLTPFSMVG